VIELSRHVLETLRRMGSLSFNRSRWKGDRPADLVLSAPHWNTPLSGPKRLEHEYSLRPELGFRLGGSTSHPCRREGRPMLILETLAASH